MKLNEVNVKSIITKSSLPDADFVINPYIGCVHSCLYCYARFMKRFTNHPEPWGKFLDVKINSPELLKNTQKYKNKSILLSSVTDPYQFHEKKYELTRKILEKLILLQPDLCILTKSDLIIRDIDLLKKFKTCKAGISLSTLDNSIIKQIEPFTPYVEKRLNAVKTMKKAGISTFIFISPLLPELTSWREIILVTKNFADEFWFENLNLYPSIQQEIFNWLKNHHPYLLDKYKKIYFAKNNYWNNVESEIKKFCKNQNINFTIYFHHKPIG